MSSAPNVRKRGGTFSRSQIELIRKYLLTGNLPSLENLLDSKLFSDGPSGVYARVKSTRNRLALVDNHLIHISGKRVIAREEFVTEIAKVHKGENGEPHLNFVDTLAKLSEVYTIGRRTHGMSKKLIEAVVKGCNTGSCRKRKKSRRKREYEDVVRKFARKCLTTKTCPQTTVAAGIADNAEIEGSMIDSMKEGKKEITVLAHTIVKCGDKSLVKKLEEDKITPTLVQIKGKSSSTAAVCSTENTSKPDKIAVGPFPISLVKNIAGTNQYQLILPLVNKQVALPKNVASTSTLSKTSTVFSIPIFNVSTGSNIPIGPLNVQSVGNMCTSGNMGTTQTVNISQLSLNLPFTTLLQNAARNSQNTFKLQVPNSTWIQPTVKNVSLALSNTSQSSTNAQADLSSKPADFIINVPACTNKTSSVKDQLKQSITTQPKKTALSKLEPATKKTKTFKEMIAVKQSSTLADLVTKNKEQNEDCFIADNSNIKIDNPELLPVSSDVPVIDENNNDNSRENNHNESGMELDADWSDENTQVLEEVKTCGVYRNCLRALTGLPMEDFETVMDRMTTSLFSEGPNPYSLQFHALPDPSYPHIWYFPHEIREESNIFKRIMIVMKDIKVDITRSMMQEPNVLDRLKKKIGYMETLIRRNKVYLDMCTSKYRKEKKKRKRSKLITKKVNTKD